MFGFDQMIWPETLRVAIEAIDSATFLSSEQKRDILCNNARPFSTTHACRFESDRCQVIR